MNGVWHDIKVVKRVPSAAYRSLKFNRKWAFNSIFLLPKRTGIENRIFFNPFSCIVRLTRSEIRSTVYETVFLFVLGLKVKVNFEIYIADRKATTCI